MLTFYPPDVCTLSECLDETFPGAPILGAGLWVGLVSSGSCAVGAAAQSAGAGDFFVACGPLELRAQGECRLAVLRLSGSATEAAANDLEGPKLIPAQLCPACGERLTLLLAGGLTPGRTSALAYALLCDLWEAPAAGERLPLLVAEAVALLREDYATLYGVEDLAARLGVSKCHLIRLFSSHLGLTPGRYLTDLRLAAAKELLLCREYTLEAIAGLCGFSGANYFCRVFRREEGTTPSSWLERNSHRPAPRSADQIIKII